MRIVFFLFLITLLQTSRSQPANSNIPDSETYEMINTFCRFDHLKRIHKIPLRYIYHDIFITVDDSGKTTTGIDIFINRLKEIDTNHYFMDSMDFEFIRKQISNPEIKVLNRWKIHKTRLKRKQYFIPMTFAITLPLFSKDLQTAVISANYWGMSKTYLFHRNAVSKKWEFVRTLWQDGS